MTDPRDDRARPVEGDARVVSPGQTVARNPAKEEEHVKFDRW